MSFFRAYFITAPFIVLSTIGFGLVSLFISLFESTGRRQIGVARLWARSLLWASGVKVRIEGLEKISHGGSYVFASNHLSYMDTPVVLANIPVQFRFLAKRGLFQIPLLGTHLARAGHIPVPRDDARAAVRTMTTAAQVIRERGVSLLIFPEGGRSHDGRLDEFKEGAAYIAIRAGVPLVPIALKGTREVLPFGSGHVRAGAVTMRIGDPISTAGAQLRDRERITAELRERIVSLLEDQPIHA
ncbi:MAG TPA: lysophospholipid acyltransferase family protein [Bryobacteraceae bacterium]|nr:lysophospholipid acyltransferase family protein [Bryobacteraceae bacterium]